MKVLSTAFLLLGLLAAGPVSAHAHGRLQVPLVPARPVVRPLTRYLAAMLRLTPTEAAAVQQALRNRLDRTLAPEDLTLSLGAILPLEAQLRLQSLQSDATTYRALYYLAARH